MPWWLRLWDWLLTLLGLRKKIRVPKSVDVEVK